MGPGKFLPPIGVGLQFLNSFMDSKNTLIGQEGRLKCNNEIIGIFPVTTCQTFFLMRTYCYLFILSLSSATFVENPQCHTLLLFILLQSLPVAQVKYHHQDILTSQIPLTLSHYPFLLTIALDKSPTCHLVIHKADE